MVVFSQYPTMGLVGDLSGRPQTSQAQNKIQQPAATYKWLLVVQIKGTTSPNKGYHDSVSAEPLGLAPTNADEIEAGYFAFEFPARSSPQTPSHPARSNGCDRSRRSRPE